MIFLRRKLLFFLIFIFAVVNLNATVQNYICVVRPQFNENELKFYDDALKSYEKSENKINKSGKNKEDSEKSEENDSSDNQDDNLENNYYNNFGYDKKIIGTVFGSGFVYVSENGTNYVLTNYHVIENYTKAYVEFFDSESGEKKCYEDLQVVAISTEVDLALLEFPKGEKPFKQSFSFYEPKAIDGQTVFSAGYPAILSKPSWQFSKGNISNSSYYNKIMFGNSYPYVIQHTSPIDSGNSGGPLLIEDEKSALGYLVIGINTWKVNKRTLTSFSIPVETIKKFLDSYFISKSEEKNKAELEEVLNEFALNLYKKTRIDDNLKKFISHSFIENISYDDFDVYCNNYNLNNIKKLLKPVYKDFYGINEARRSVLAFLLYQKYKTYNNSREKTNVTLQIKEIKKIEENKYSVIFKDSEEKNFIKSVWNKEMNIWVISECSYTSDSKKYDLEKKYSLEKKSLFDWSNVISFKFISFETFFMLEKSNFTKGNNNNYWGFNSEINIFLRSPFSISIGNKWQLTDDDSLCLFTLGTNFQFKIQLGRIIILPFAKINADLSLTSKEPVYGWSWGGGVTIAYYTKSEISYGLRFNYSNYNLYHFNKELDEIKFTTMGIGFYLNVFVDNLLM